MDLTRQYIVQCITAAANNLRLNTEKIEVVSLLKEYICSAGDLENEIRNMKKVTELSTFAIKLGEIYSYIAKSKVDFLKVSEKFKEHCFSLVKDLSGVLEKLNPKSFRQLAESMRTSAKKPEISVDQAEENKEEQAKTFNMAVHSKAIVERTGEINSGPAAKSETIVLENERIKEDFLLDTEKKANPILFENYEERILTPIKEMDQFLKNIAQNQVSKEEIQKYYRIVKDNAELSANIGFDIIAAMHRVFGRALGLIYEDKVIPDKDYIAGMRAALIVIVAVVRGKEVDITGYLNKAEELGKIIQNLK